MLARKAQSPFVHASSGLDLQALRVELGSLTDSGWAESSPAQKGVALGAYKHKQNFLRGPRMDRTF